MVETSAAVISACLTTLGPLVKSIRASLGFKSTSSDDPSSHGGTGLETIGGSDMKKGGSSEKSKGKSAGSRPFRRLTENSSTGSLVKVDEQAREYPNDSINVIEMHEG